MSEPITKSNNQNTKDTAPATKEAAAPKKSEEDTRNIVLNISEEQQVEIINLVSSVRSTLVPKDNKLKLNNANLYHIPITNKSLDIDSMNAIKVMFKFCESVQILGVQNGIVVVKPITNTLVLKHKDVIGSLL